MVGHLASSVSLSDEDRGAGSLPCRIEARASRQGVTMPNGWKALGALSLVSGWAKTGWRAPDQVLDCAARLFEVMTERLS
jgi:hypothetical protein